MRSIGSPANLFKGCPRVKDNNTPGPGTDSTFQQATIHTKKPLREFYVKPNSWQKHHPWYPIRYGDFSNARDNGRECLPARNPLGAGVRHTLLRQQLPDRASENVLHGRMASNAPICNIDVQTRGVPSIASTSSTRTDMARILFHKCNIGPTFPEQVG